jgi:ribose transport system permease protein
VDDLRRHLRSRPYLFALGVAVVLLGADVIVDPSFGAPGNWDEVLTSIAPFALVAMASTPSVISGRGGLDLSIGPLTILLNIVFVVWLLPHGLGSGLVAVPILVVAGAAIGAVNGILVAVLRYQPVIATLCGLFILTGLSASIADTPRVAQGNFTENLAGTLGPVPGALVLLALPAAVWFALDRTPFLRTLYGVGGDDVTTFTAGVDVVRVRVLAYALGGVFASFGALAVTALLQSANPALGLQYTLIALAAVALGGTPIGGGRGGLFGSLCGAAVIYLVQTLLASLHVSVDWLNLVYGAMLAIGVVIGAQLTRIPAGRARA